ncbi:MAG: phospholipid-binding lipoprotein MlaA [Glaciecola sp.]|jgi:phospholipid-binding lipoprotein MlaA
MTTKQKYAVTPRFRAIFELSSLRLSAPFGTGVAIFLLLLMTGSPLYAEVDNDPFEKVNRITYSLNGRLDDALLKPFASGYQSYTPKVAKQGIQNFFDNLDDIRVGVNDLMQLRFTQAAKDFGRFITNSTLGVAGLFDIAEPAFNLEKNKQDFGKTLAHWGVGSGPYLVLPFFGPSTARDALGLSVDAAAADPIPAIDHVRSRNGLLATKSTDRRAGYLALEELIIGDEYLFVRGLYLQGREHATNGGNVQVTFDDF